VTLYNFFECLLSRPPEENYPRILLASLIATIELINSKINLNCPPNVKKMIDFLNKKDGLYFLNKGEQYIIFEDLLKSIKLSISDFPLLNNKF